MILNEIIKNGKLIFRNWSSLLLLVLGPLLIIFIIGATFGGEEAHGVVVGLSGADEMFLKSFGNFTNVKEYSSNTDCLEDLKQNNIHLCILIEKFTGELSQTSIQFFYDPSRKKLTNLLIAQTKEALGEKAEDISLLATKTILDKIQSLVILLDDKQSNVDSLLFEANNTLTQLVERGDRLVEVRDSFLPTYVRIKEIQVRIENQTIAGKEKLGALRGELDGLKDDVDDLYLLYTLTAPDLNNNMNRNLNVTDIINWTINRTNIGVFFMNGTSKVFDRNSSEIISKLNDFTFSSIDSSFDNVLSSLNETEQQFDLAKKELDAAVLELDKIKVLLDDEIKFNDEAIVKINTGVERIKELREELQKGIAEVIIYDPSIAEKLVKPILENYEPIKELKNVQIVFSGLLVMVIVFITLLFSNILTLAEINSPAYFRNLISPVNNIVFSIGLFITTIILVLFQISILFLIAEYQFSVPIFANLGDIYLLSLMLVIIFTFIGMSIAYSVKNNQTAVLATTFAALGVYLFSNLLTPLELMPEIVATIASYNPIIPAEQMFRLLLLFNVPYPSQGLLVLGLYCVFFLVVAMFLHKRFVNSKR